MYQCLNCHRLFEEPKQYEEKHGLDLPPYEILYCCPFCGGDYEPAKPKTFLTFTKTLMSDGAESAFFKGKRYEVSSETEDAYYLGYQNSHKVGVGKELEGKLYTVEVEEPCL